MVPVPLKCDKKWKPPLIVDDALRLKNTPFRQLFLKHGCVTSYVASDPPPPPPPKQRMGPIILYGKKITGSAWINSLCASDSFITNVSLWYLFNVTFHIICLLDCLILQGGLCDDDPYKVEAEKCILCKYQVPVSYKVWWCFHTMIIAKVASAYCLSKIQLEFQHQKLSKLCQYGVRW